MFTVLAACLLLHHPTVIDPASGSVRVADIVIRDGRIASGDCDQRVDLTGKFLMPGLIDMHAHLTLHAWDKKGNLRPKWDRESTLDMLQLFLRFGVTTVRDPGAETEVAVKLRDMRVDGPAIVTAGRILNSGRLDAEPFVQLHTADEVRREIDWQARAGVDLIKIYSAIEPDLAKVAIDAAHAHHLPIIGHLQLTTWTQAAEMGIDGVEHAAPWSEGYLPEAKRAGYQQDLFGRVYWLESLDWKTIDAMIATLVKHHVVVDPTLMAMHTKFFGNQDRWLKNPDNALMPARWLEGWPAGSFTRGWTDAQYAEARSAWPILLRLTKQMHDAGVTMVVGTDTPTPWIVPGASVHDEMALLRDAGIPPMAILKMATWNGAVALHRETEIGAIRTGMRADLIVLTKNPLDDIRNTRSIDSVYKSGILKSSVR